MAWLVHIVVAALLMSCSVKAKIGYCTVMDRYPNKQIRYCVRVRTSAWVWRTLIKTNVQITGIFEDVIWRLPQCSWGCGTEREIEASLTLPGAKGGFFYGIVRRSNSDHDSGYKFHPLEYRYSGAMAGYKGEHKGDVLEASPLAVNVPLRDQQSKKTNTGCFGRKAVSRNLKASRTSKVSKVSKISESKKEALEFETDTTLNPKQLTKRRNSGVWQGFTAEKEARKAMVEKMGLCTLDTALTDKGNEAKPSYQLTPMMVRLCVGGWTKSGWQTIVDGDYAADIDLFENEKFMGALTDHQHKIPHCNNGCALASEISSSDVETRYALECEGEYTAIDHRAADNNPALIGLQEKELKKWKDKTLIWRMTDADYSMGFFAAIRDYERGSECKHREAEGIDTDEMSRAVEKRKLNEKLEVERAEANAEREKKRQHDARTYAQSNASRRPQQPKRSAPRRRRPRKNVWGQSDDSGSDEEFDNDNGRSEE